MVLGSAASGGVPQWNCWCPVCRTARRAPDEVRPRTQSSIALSSDGRRWVLCNASPDVSTQLDRIPLAEPAGGRHLRFDAILLSDGELEHSLGLLSLRDAYALSLCLAPGPLEVITRGSHLLPTLRAFTDVTVTELPPGTTVSIRGRSSAVATGLSVEAIPLGRSPSRLGVGAAGAVTALIVADDQSRSRIAIVPRCPVLDAALIERLASVDAIFFDGTFWSDDALIDLGFTTRTARELGHVPISGPEGSLRELAALPAAERVYIHLDNTNPVLVEGSRERMAVESAGVQVGADGMRFIV